MKKYDSIQFLLALTACVIFAAGCTTLNVNPPQAKANTGYVDFRGAETDDLWWEVSRFDEPSQTFQKVFSELRPPEGGIVRLALPPGPHRLRVTFLNHAIAKPAELEVTVPDGKVTPVRVALTEAGIGSVRTVEHDRGGTVKGRYGRRTNVSSDETILYRPVAVADAPVAYQLKERMPYAH